MILKIPSIKAFPLLKSDLSALNLVTSASWLNDLELSLNSITVTNEQRFAFTMIPKARFDLECRDNPTGATAAGQVLVDLANEDGSVMQVLESGATVEVSAEQVREALRAEGVPTGLAACQMPLAVTGVTLIEGLFWFANGGMAYREGELSMKSSLEGIRLVR